MSFTAGKPKPLFDLRGDTLVSSVMPDAEQFLGIAFGTPDASANTVNVVLNWSEELKQKVKSK